MKRIVALICILLVAITALCACDGSFTQKSPIKGDGFNAPTPSPYQSQSLPNKGDVHYKVYICGAVQREGYYVVPEGTTVAQAVTLAGLLPETFMPENATTYIKNNCQIIVNYHENDRNFDCLNVNGAMVQYNLPVENIPANIIQKLHTYLQKYGKIANKQVLEQILTSEEYAQNHYKLFVTEDDYEENS